MPETTPTEKTAPTGGRIVAWAGFVFGSLISVGANVLAAWIPPAGTGPTWHPSIWAEVGAAAWPVALLLAVEILARNKRPANRVRWLARYVGVGSVAIGAAVISYGHINAILSSWGYNVAAAGVGPLVIDGLMIVSGFAMLEAPGAHPGGDPVAPPVASDDAELKARAQWIFSQNPEIGRYKLCDALNIGRTGQLVTENQARKILDDLRKEAAPQLQVVNDGQ